MITLSSNNKNDQYNQEIEAMYYPDDTESPTPKGLLPIEKNRNQNNMTGMSMVVKSNEFQVKDDQLTLMKDYQ